MSEKQRGEVDFCFENGYFRDFSSIEPIQLYRFFERDSEATIVTEKSLFDFGTVALLYCVSGEARVNLQDSVVPVRDGTLILCDIETARGLKFSNDAKSFHYIGLSLSFFDRVSPHSTVGDLWGFFSKATLPIVADDAQEIYQLLALLIDELAHSPQQMQSLIRGLLYQVLVMSYRAFHKSDSLDFFGEPSLQAVGHTVYAIIRYIDEHLYSMDHLTGMAKDLGYSYNYLSHLFRKKTGMTIQMYVSRKKIEKSMELLTKHRMSITEVASLLNYDCIQSFSKAFKRAMKMSPTEYRALHGVVDSN